MPLQAPGHDETEDAHVEDCAGGYADGSVATVQQTTAPALRIGDRVRVTGTGNEARQ